ncbi:MAG: NADH-quinone oxidoreductase subunit C [Bacteroidetes bacterium]|nr:NADH-quinone oxidoreductase subunit C [Bacteroidota bacterium]
MSNEELKSELVALHPSLVFEEGGEWLNMVIEPSELIPFAEKIRSADHLFFDYLFCLTCVDWKTHLTMVYHFSSTKYRHTIVLKSKLDRNNPEIETLCRIWKTAEFHEREVFELFGVKFLHHPDLRNLILPDVWNGFPLRKDYEDAVNMIKL